ncbi:hypothetical protein ABFA07_007627 [Porites harrisoni]
MSFFPIYGNQVQSEATSREFTCLDRKLLRLFYKFSLKMSHTILLIQPTSKPESRTYSDYETKEECMESVCKIFEEYLKRSNPSTPSITYDISQLFDYIDSLTDLTCLVRCQKEPYYEPHNKEWIKENIYVMLRKQAGK